MSKQMDDLMEEILQEIKDEEKNDAEIIKNGCPHETKVLDKYLLSGTKYLRCKRCYKEFNLDGTEK